MDAKTMATESLIGHVIGGYRLVRVLSEQEGSATLLGQHVDASEQQAAIKIALAPWGTPAEQGGLRAQFNREAQALFALQHPHLLGIYALGVDVVTGNPYMVLPYPQGGTLAERISEGPLPLPTVAEYLAQLADALDTAHAQDMVHGDLTPASILLDDAEQLYLGGFGKAPSHAAYMAPELARGEIAAPAADRYSLGVVLYEMVTGYVPFQGATQAIVLMQHAQLPPPPPRALRSELSEQAEAVMLRALAKQPAARFASATALADAFARGLKGESLPDEETTHPEGEMVPVPFAEAPVAVAPVVGAPVAEPATSAAPVVAPQATASPEPSPVHRPTPAQDVSPPPPVVPPLPAVSPGIEPVIEPEAAPHPIAVTPPSASDTTTAAEPSAEPLPPSPAPVRAVPAPPVIVPVTTNAHRVPSVAPALSSQPALAAPEPAPPVVVPVRTTPSIAPAASQSSTTTQSASPALTTADRPATKYLVPPALIRNILLAIFALVLGIAAIAMLQFLGIVELALAGVVVALFMYCGIILPGISEHLVRQAKE